MARQAATETSVDRGVAPKQLIALIKEATTEKTKIASIAGALGERIKNAVDNGHLHRQAFALVVKLHRAEEQKREEMIRSIMFYIDICRAAGLFGAEHHGDLVSQAESREDDAEEAEAGEAGESEAGAAVAAGISEIKPRGRPRKGALDGAVATSGARIQ